MHRNLFFTDVEVTSSPSNAQVYLDGFYRGKTPIMLQDLKVHHTYEICLKKNGYPDYCYSLSPKKSKNLFAELKKEYDRISAVPEERNEIIKGKIPPNILITSHDTSRGIKVVENKKKIKLIGKVIGENGIVEIIVNGQEAHFDNLGNFETSVYLSIGENKIDVSAMDRYENRAYKTFTIIRQGSFASNKKSNEIVTSGQYYALVIGNNNYKYLRKLETATRDAQIVDEALKTLFNFETTLLIDVSRNEIIKALNNFRNKLKRNDNFLIYYAGHGVFDKAANKAYWLPVDAQNNDDTNWIIADTVTSNIRRISSNHILIVSDSCYSGTFTRMSKLDISSAEQRNRFLKRMQSKKSRTLLASGGNEPVSDIGGEGHSVFAKAFIEGLRSIGQNEFTAEELYYQYVKESVAGNSEQTPEYNIIRNSGHEGGDFVFIKIK